MKYVEINRKPQENGLYGMPLNCYNMKGIPPIHDSRKYMLFSAFIVAIDEKYDTKFEILIKNNQKFCILLTHNKYDSQRTFSISYDKYEYNDGKIYIFDDDEERLTFLRKLKLKTLEKYV